MNDMLNVVRALQDTPIPLILVGAGIVFLFLALSGGIYGKIQIPHERQKWAGMLGSLLLLVGMVFYIPSLLQNAGPTNGESASQVSDRRAQDEEAQEAPSPLKQEHDPAELARLRAERERLAREEAERQRAEKERLAEEAARFRAEQERLVQEEERRRQAEEARTERLRRDSEQDHGGVDIFVSEFSLTPEVPVQGQPVEVRIGVYNRGTKRSGPFKVQWWAGKNFQGPEREWHIDGMSARGGRVLTHTYRGYRGWHNHLTTRVMIDPGQSSKDTTPANNILDTDIRVRKP